MNIISQKIKNYQYKNTQNKILKKLIAISQNNLYKIDYSRTFINTFNEVSIDELFKILYMLSCYMYIDIDYLDTENHIFQTIYILPAAHEHISNQSNQKTMFLLEVISVILAFVAAITGIISVLR